MELVPQGTFRSDSRGGAGVGVFHADRIRHGCRRGKETQVIDGKPYVLESPIHADFAFVRVDGRSWAIWYRRPLATTVMATAGVTIAEVEHLVIGAIDRSCDYPGIFVTTFSGRAHEKRVEKRTVRS